MKRQNALLVGILFCTAALTAAQLTPGWEGDLLIDCNSSNGWNVEHDAASDGSIGLVDGVRDRAVEMRWTLDGDWVQAKYTFSSPVDLTSYDLFGLSLHGSPGIPNRVSLMFADKNGVFYGLNCDDINVVNRWMVNLSFPKKLFYHFFTIPDNGQGSQIDWSQIDRFFVVVKRPGAGQGGGSGALAIDHIQADRAAEWSRQNNFSSITPNNTAKEKALGYIRSQQRASGLVLSWQEEASPKAWLYDQALALLVLTREGEWQEGWPADEVALQADLLAAFLSQKQKNDGHWARAWNPDTGAEIADDGWVGDQAWAVMALSDYAAKAKNSDAANAAQKAAGWLAAKVANDGFVTASTEGTVDMWWALMATGLEAKANLIKNRLLTVHWDDEMKYWYRGFSDRPDPVIAMDAATWMSEFARSPQVNRPDMALAALSFVRRTLVTSDSAGSIFGFDGQGPVSIWCEGTAQYISAGGEEAQMFLDQLLTLQRADGGMPGSTESWPGNCFGWLTTWTGIAPTAWLYFALTKSPFAHLLSTNVETSDMVLPQKLELQQNYPNPANPGTTIRYTLPEAGMVSIQIYNINGQRVADLVHADMPAGRHTIRWEGQTSAGQAAATGVYFYRLQFGVQVLSRKFLLLR